MKKYINNNSSLFVFHLVETVIEDFAPSENCIHVK